jgi:hypothetical protein
MVFSLKLGKVGGFNGAGLVAPGEFSITQTVQLSPDQIRALLQAFEHFSGSLLFDR